MTGVGPLFERQSSPHWPAALLVDHLAAGCGWFSDVRCAPHLWDNPGVAGVVRPEVRRRGERQAMAGGDEAEFEAFAARDGGRLLGFALLLAGNRQDAEDLVQLALLRSAGRWPAAREHPERPPGAHLNRFPTREVSREPCRRTGCSGPGTLRSPWRSGRSGAWPRSGPPPPHGATPARTCPPGAT
jgi:hypothetical protein